jgi:hypothetical protein
MLQATELDVLGFFIVVFHGIPSVSGAAQFSLALSLSFVRLSAEPRQQRAEAVIQSALEHREM